MGHRGVICFKTLELLADGLKCSRVRPSFLAAASAFESIFLRMRPRDSCVFVCGTDLHRPCFQFRIMPAKGSRRRVFPICALLGRARGISYSTPFPTT